MSAYLKKIAVIKQVKGGFSADGGSVSGLVKAETYAGFLKVEASLINFAPLTEGRYVLGITDGLNTVTFEGLTYEGERQFNLSSGFAFLVCFCNNTVAPVASASCGEMACALPDLKSEMVRLENINAPKTNSSKSGNGKSGVAVGGGGTVTPKAAFPKTGEGAPDSVTLQEGGAVNAGAGAQTATSASAETPYDDEAISEVNYFEDTFQGGTPLRQVEEKEADGDAGGEDAQDFGSVQGEEIGKRPRGRRTGSRSSVRVGDAASEATASDGRDGRGGLAGGDFYGRMEADIKKIFATYPRVDELERAVEGSRFAKISYGDDKFYVFGVLTVEGKPRYICYGVPAQDPENPPQSLKNFASYVPVQGGGYWMTYQDASTGISVKLLQT